MTKFLCRIGLHWRKTEKVQLFKTTRLTSRFGPVAVRVCVHCGDRKYGLLYPRRFS